jgi:hypothetical protein
MKAYCLRCRESYTEHPALSRRDNKTYICSRCGGLEAMNDFTPYSQLPEDQVLCEKIFHEKIGVDFSKWLRWKIYQGLDHTVVSAKRGHDDTCKFGCD